MTIELTNRATGEPLLIELPNEEGEVTVPNGEWLVHEQIPENVRIVGQINE